MSLLWTHRELDIVETLTRRVRLLSTAQIRRVWWTAAGSERIVRRRLRRLQNAGLVAHAIANVHPVLQVNSPLTSWSNSAPAPDFEAVSQNARRRWTEPSEPTDVFFATRLAGNLFGSTSHGLPPLTHRNHDLLLGQVYVHYRTSHSELARRWVSEDVMSKAGFRVKDPDAFLLDDDGQFERVIESAGAYSVKQVQSFHWHCVEYDLPYELW